MQSMQSPRRLPEFKALIETARSLVAGKAHFSEVCVAAGAFDEAAKMYVVDPRVRQIASDWIDMARRVWPEWDQVQDPVTPQEFQDWVQFQLSVFDAMERQE
jgi:hypothetical protein